MGDGERRTKGVEADPVNFFHRDDEQATASELCSSGRGCFCAQISLFQLELCLPLPRGHSIPRVHHRADYYYEARLLFSSPSAKSRTAGHARNAPSFVPLAGCAFFFPKPTYSDYRLRPSHDSATAPGTNGRASSGARHNGWVKGWSLCIPLTVQLTAPPKLEAQSKVHNLVAQGLTTCITQWVPRFEAPGHARHDQGAQKISRAQL